MIKIKDNLPRKDRCGLIQTTLDDHVLHLLREEDIYIGDYNNDYDYVFEYANTLDPDNVLPNTIAFERIDGCQIRNKKLLQSDNLIKLVKSYKYKDLEVNNLDCVTNRIFTRLLNPKETKEQNIKVTRQMFNKVVTGLSFWHYFAMNDLEFFLENKPFDNKRDIDIFFAGYTTYGDNTHAEGKLITEHRLSCIDKINSLKNLNTETKLNRAYTRDEYFKKTYNTKIIVSPWGWGESCHRDYEALALGCAVIKPWSYDIECNPQIYDENTMYFCKPDWSDLPEVVEQAKFDYEYKISNREAISKLMFVWREVETKVSIMKKILGV